MDKIILTQTDTTVGFLSQNASRLEAVKMRPENKSFLKVYAELKQLKQDIRIPDLHKHRVRHSKKTTFVLKNQAFRFVSDPEHTNLIKPFGWLFSTSANKSGEKFDRDFCLQVSDIIIEDFRGLTEQSASTIFKLNTSHIKQLR